MPLEKLRILNRLDAALATFLVNALEKADKDALKHSVATAEICHLYASMSENTELPPDVMWLAGFLHDVGKLGISRRILDKASKLSSKELRIVQAHAPMGEVVADRLFKAPHLGKVILHHHERFDGQGYPTGLSGTEIPLMSQVVAIASTYDTLRSAGWMLSHRSHQVALDELKEQAGKQFDPDIVGYFLKIESSVYIAHKAARALSAKDIISRF